MSASASSQPEHVVIREATPADAEACGIICYEAFRNIAERHGFVPDVPAPEHGVALLQMMFYNPQFYCVVAEVGGKIVGSNAMFAADPIASIGPITVSPDAQNGAVGRLLMQNVMDHARELSKPGVRLVQSGYHVRSLSLYAKLGFVVREPLAVMQGSVPRCGSLAGTVRAAVPADLDACNRLCVQVHGYDRGAELAGAIQRGTARVEERAGKIMAYASVIGFFGHAVAASNDDLKLLLCGANEFAGPGILVPLRNAELFRWCLEQGLRTGSTLNLMSIGLYNEPQGAWLPSILC